MLLVFSVVGFSAWLAGQPGRIATARKHPEAEVVKMMGWTGLPPTVQPWVQAFMWAFRPTDAVEFRRLPPKVERASELEIATAQQAQASAACGGAALTAFREVADALGNESLIANRLQYTEAALVDSTDAVRIATIQYRYGSRDLLWVSNLQTAQIRNQAEVIKVRNLQRTNRINLFLALGGSYDAEPAAPAPDQSGAETEVQEQDPTAAGSW